MRTCFRNPDAGFGSHLRWKSFAGSAPETWVFRCIAHSASPRQNQETYREELRDSDTVVSCVGGFGATSAYMDLVNGDANVKLAEVR